MSALRVLFAYRDDVDVQGGAAVVMQQTARELRELGVTVDVSFERRPDPSGYDVVHAWNIWRPDTALEQLEHLRAAGATVVWQPFYLSWSEYTWARAAIPAVLGGERPETEREALLAALAAGEVAVGELTQRGENEATPGLHSVVRRMHELVDHLCACSVHEVKELNRLTRAAHAPFTLTMHGVDGESYAGASPEPFRERFGVEDYVLCVGSVDGRKNQLMLCEALRGTGLPVVLAGPCYEPAYLRLCLQRGEHVVHTDRISPELVASAYAGAAAHALPSFAEGSALASLEAAAAGCPVVVSNRSSEFEYYGDLAYFCDPADVASIRRAVLLAHEQRGDLERRRALEQRMAGLTWRRTAEATLEAYERALGARSAREAKRCGLVDGRPYRLLADADELMGDPDLVRAFAAGWGRRDDVTLAIWAGSLDGDRQTKLQATLAGAGLDDDEVTDLLVLPALDENERALLARQLHGALTRRGLPGPFDRLPVLG